MPGVSVHSSLLLLLAAVAQSNSILLSLSVALLQSASQDHLSSGVSHSSGFPVDESTRQRLTVSLEPKVRA